MNLGGIYMKRKVMAGVYTKDGEKFSFDFFTSINIAQKVSFVNRVVNSVINDNYYNFLVDIIFDYTLIDMLTDVDTSYINNSETPLNLIEELLNITNIVEIVKANAEDGLIEDLRKSVELAIEYRTGIHKNPIAESLSQLLNTIEKKVSVIDTNGLMEAAQAISGVSGELTAEKMLEAYAKSDVFKQRYEQVIADRNYHNDKIDEIAKEVKGGKKSKSSK